MPRPPPRLRLSAPKRREARLVPLAHSYMVKGKIIGDFWRRLARASSSSTRGSGWAPSGLTPLALGVSSCPEPPGAP